MQPILRLIKTTLCVRVDHLVSHFRAPDARAGSARRWHRVSRDFISAAFTWNGWKIFARSAASDFLTHAGPDIGLDNVGVLDGGDRIVRDLDRRAGCRGVGLGLARRFLGSGS